MDKQKLIEELKMKRKEEAVEKTAEVEEIKQELIPVSNEKISTSKKNRRRKRKKINKDINLNSTEVVDVRYNNENYKKFKEGFLKDENVMEFRDFIEYHKSKGDDVFDFDFFAYNKMLENKIKTVVIDPSLDDIARGVGSKFYMVKPMYNNEYVQFVKDFGPRENFPEQFLTRMFETSILYPQNLTSDQIKKMPTGTVLSIYRVILDISDFNKSYRIIEV